LATTILTRWAPVRLKTGRYLVSPQALADDPEVPWSDLTDQDPGTIYEYRPVVIEIADDAPLDLDRMEGEGWGFVLTTADRPGQRSEHVPDEDWFHAVPGRLECCGVIEEARQRAMSESVCKRCEASQRRQTRGQVLQELKRQLGDRAWLPPEAFLTQQPPPNRPEVPPAKPPPAADVQAILLQVSLQNPGTPRPLDEVSDLLKICRNCPEGRFNGRHCTCHRIMGSEQLWLEHLADASKGCPRYHW
jgi:hypothetical protein